jgi:hypothetical protein
VCAERQEVSSVSFGEAVGEPPISDRARARAAQVSLPWYDTAGGTGFLEPALWWARNVAGVFPLTEANNTGVENPGKTPAGPGSQWDESRHITDESTIRELWTARPWCNVGVATISSGFLVLDVDPRDGGNHSLAELAAEAEIDLADVPRQESPRGDGGIHLWWKLPQDAPPIKCGSPLDGVDIPWQTPVAPSLRQVEVGEDSHGRAVVEYLPYRWVAGDPSDLPLVPHSLLTVLAELGRVKGHTPSKPGRGKAASRFAPVTLDVARLLTSGIPMGRQNSTIYALAASLARRGTDLGVAIQTIETILQKSPQDGRNLWTRADLYGSGTPGTYDWKPGLVTRAYEFISERKEAEAYAAQRQLAWAASIGQRTMQERL